MTVHVDHALYLGFDQAPLIAEQVLQIGGLADGRDRDGSIVRLLQRCLVHLGKQGDLASDNNSPQ